jgi:hypothetical protein
VNAHILHHINKATTNLTQPDVVSQMRVQRGAVHRPPGTAADRNGPGSAAHHFVLHRARHTGFGGASGSSSQALAAEINVRP